MTTERIAIPTRSDKNDSPPPPKVSDPGPLPCFDWISKDQFTIDKTYQRDISTKQGQRTVARILKSFSWAKFQPPTVTKLSDGTYAVIDGQHRIQAALMHPAIDKIPVYVVTAPNIAEQADSFVSINKDRVPVHQLGLHHARLAAGDEMALRVKAVCDEADVTIPRAPAAKGETKPRETAALGAITQGILDCGEAPVIAALMVLADAYDTERGAMRSRVIKALIAIFHKRGVREIDREIMIKALQETSSDELEANATAYRSIYGGGALDAIEAAIIRHYNEAAPRKARLV